MDGKDERVKKGRKLSHELNSKQTLNEARQELKNKMKVNNPK